MLWRCPICGFGTSDEESGWEHVQKTHTEMASEWEKIFAEGKNLRGSEEEA